MDPGFLGHGIPTAKTKGSHLFRANGSVAPPCRRSARKAPENLESKPEVADQVSDFVYLWRSPHLLHDLGATTGPWNNLPYQKRNVKIIIFTANRE